MLPLLLATLLAVATPPSPPVTAGQRQVSITSADGSVLSGTLSWPQDSPGAAPAFVLIAGGGLQDRDETIGPNKPLAQIAAALNAAGFAVLRYDKRGAGSSTSATPLAAVTRQQYIDDVLAAVASLKKDPQVDPSRIYLLGHSEGGELAIGATLQGAPVRGLVLLSPVPIPYAQLLTEQASRMHATPAQTAHLQTLIATTPFLQSYADVDPRAEVARVGVPILLLHGGKDFEVTTGELTAFVASAHAAHRSLQYGELDGDNHFFAELPQGTDSTGKEYFSAYPVDPRVFAAIQAWMAETQ